MSRKFRQWVDDYQDQAWTLARYLLKDPAEAEDACQEAFVKLWRNQDRIDPERIKPWLMKVTRNVCLDRLRRRHPTEEWEEWQQPEDGAVWIQPGPLQDLQQHELGEWLKHSINGLTEPYRSLVVLRDVQQHSYEEVANVLELSLTQVKVYLHRARKQLREQLAEVRP
jgi:RNA polymerase sigma-70 factor, ECF subfamily